MPELGPEKRILLAFAFSTLVLVLWSLYMQKKYPRPPVSAPASPAPVAAVESPPASAVKAQGAVPGQPSAQKMGREEREIVVEGDLYRLVFSTRGAAVKSWTLKHYRDARGKPLDVVNAAASAQLGYPLSVALADAEREKVLNQALFVASTEAAELWAPTELAFEFSDGKLAATKRFRFRHDYVVELETAVYDQGTQVEHGIAWRGSFGDASLETSWADLRVVWREPGRLDRKPADKITEQEPFNQTFSAYAGLEDRYFAAVFLPAGPEFDQAQSLTARRLQWQATGAEKPSAGVAVAIQAKAAWAGRLFVGPKALGALERIQPAGNARALDEMVDFGWFALIAKPIFLALRGIQNWRWVRNYGWAIVLLTIIINMALFPLKWKSMQSAWKMQKIAPQLRVIQEKYKKYRFNDPRKQPMQQEMMALYRQHGVSPFGGCLPLVLQIPFFVAFYNVLLTAIELRHAPWFGWIRDLSARDPYYILPIIMTVTMYVSTKMTPMTTADPAQQKMMTLMPVLFGVMFLTISSGLVLYWMVSNVVGIGQQYWINRYQRAREAAEKQAKRKKKP